LLLLWKLKLSYKYNFALSRVIAEKSKKFPEFLKKIEEKKNK